ncbi:MAG: hypothetical protein ACTS41_01690 [Candidatus Hodgkinia cicadicola]
MRSIWAPLLRSEKLSPRPPPRLHHPDPSSALSLRRNLATSD